MPRRAGSASSRSRRTTCRSPAERCCTSASTTAGRYPTWCASSKRQNIGVAQPNYVYRLQQDGRTPAPLAVPSVPPLPRGDPAQYAVAKLHLAEAHKIATGAGVLVAVIDSQIDTGHPDLGGTIAGAFDAVGNREKPDEHGTEMTGAIVAHRKLLGVAPRARILAIHAFSPEAQSSAQTTTAHILAGIDWAIAKGARVINMSFAGPHDPLLSHALKKAHDKGIVLVAAAGNAGPQSPPLYPAADENVIAVTAIDENDKLLPQANQGPHVALAAPGVNVLAPAPGGAYGYTTGTSVATAHVTGVVALIIERDPGHRRRHARGGPLLDRPRPRPERTRQPVRVRAGGPAARTRCARGEGRDEQGHVAGRGDADAEAAPRLGDDRLGDERLGDDRKDDGEPAPADPVGSGAGEPGSTRPDSAEQGCPASSACRADPESGPGPAPVQSQPQFPANAAASLTPATPANRVPSRSDDARARARRDCAGGTTPAATDPSTDFVPVAEKRRLDACMQDGVTRGHRGADLRDYAVVCLAEARLTCLKQAVAQRVRGPDRRDFMGRCLGS